MARKNKKAGAAPLTSPQTREELYLANIAGLVNTKPEYPFTRTERYLDAISSGTSGLSDRVTALETGKVNTLGKGVNLLDNWYFVGGGTTGAFPVNQRGVSQYQNAGFGIDRWWWWTNTDYSLSSAGIVLKAEKSIAQLIDANLSASLVGKAITMSCLTSAGLATASFVWPADSNGYVENAGISLIAGGAVPGLGLTLPIFLITALNADVTLIAAKLELGTQQTLARQVNGAWVLNDTPPNYQQELAKCQRYLCKFAQYMYFMPSGETNTDAFVTVPVCMARKPNIIGNIAGGTNWDVIIYSPYSNQLRIRSATAIIGAVECDGDVYFSAE